MISKNRLLYLSKLFNTVDYEMLIDKGSIFGCRGKLKNLLESCLKKDNLLSIKKFLIKRNSFWGSSKMSTESSVFSQLYNGSCSGTKEKEYCALC